MLVVHLVVKNAFDRPPSESAPAYSADSFEGRLEDAVGDGDLSDADIASAAAGRRVDRTPDSVTITLVREPERCESFEVPLPIITGGSWNRVDLDVCPPAG
jgi:hypothetical protein